MDLGGVRAAPESAGDPGPKATLLPFTEHTEHRLEVQVRYSNTQEKKHRNLKLRKEAGNPKALSVMIVIVGFVLHAGRLKCPPVRPDQEGRNAWGPAAAGVNRASGIRLRQRVPGSPRPSDSLCSIK